MGTAGLTTGIGISASTGGIAYGQGIPKDRGGRVSLRWTAGFRVESENGVPSPVNIEIHTLAGFGSVVQEGTGVNGTEVLFRVKPASMGGLTTTWGGTVPVSGSGQQTGGTQALSISSFTAYLFEITLTMRSDARDTVPTASDPVSTGGAAS